MKTNLLRAFILLNLLNACKVSYSFTGVNTTAKTIAVAPFINRASSGPANMGINFTEKLREYYQRNSPLSVINKNAELSITGNITGFKVSPVGTTATDRAAQNRLTIEIEIDFVNNQDEKKNFTQTFSFYSDFAQDKSVNQVQNELTEIILDQIVIDIFNKTVADW